jgi:hypothetical protein
MFSVAVLCFVVNGSLNCLHVFPIKEWTQDVSTKIEVIRISYYVPCIGKAPRNGAAEVGILVYIIDGRHLGNTCIA